MSFEQAQYQYDNMLPEDVYGDEEEEDLGIAPGWEDYEEWEDEWEPEDYE